MTHSGSSYGAVEHWNGTTWTIVKSATAFFSSDAGSSASNVWAVGPPVGSLSSLP